MNQTVAVLSSVCIVQAKIIAMRWLVQRIAMLHSVMKHLGMFCARHTGVRKVIHMVIIWQTIVQSMKLIYLIWWIKL